MECKKRVYMDRNNDILCSYWLQRKQVVSQTARPGFMVKLKDVKGKAKEEPLNGDIAFPASEEPAEVHVFFGHGKGTLGLDGAIDAQQTALLRGDALFHLFPLTQEILVDIEGLGSLFQGLLAGTFADTFVFAGAALAVFTAINRSFGQKARLCLLLFYLC